jgi:hypothetical protein
MRKFIFILQITVLGYFLTNYTPLKTYADEIVKIPVVEYIQVEEIKNISQAKEIELALKPVVQPKKESPTPSTKISGSKEDWMREAGIPESEWQYVDYIVSRESGWRVGVVNQIGCIGLGQSCPGGSGLSMECPNWQNDPVCQLRHFTKYANNRYGGWQKSYLAWQNQNWW